MVTPTPTTATTSCPPDTEPGANTAALEALIGELRAFYAERFALALRAAEDAQDRFETPDGTGSIDPVFAADTAAARAVNRHLPAAMQRWLPGARCLDRHDEPAVIDSHWLHHDRVLVVDWDYTFDFGDPAGLTIWEATR